MTRQVVAYSEQIMDDQCPVAVGVRVTYANEDDELAIHGVVVLTGAEVEKLHDFWQSIKPRPMMDASGTYPGPGQIVARITP